MITKYTYKGKVIRHAKIVEGYRIGDKVRKRVLKSIGPIKNEEDLRRAKKILENMKKGEKIVSLNEIVYDRIREYGIIYAAEKLWKKSGLKDVVEQVFDKRRVRFNIFDSLFLLTVSRLYKPSSDLDTYEWIKEKAYYPTNIQLHHLYRTLDLIVKHKEEIEERIFEILKKRTKMKVDMVFYDLTSTYFEGDGPEKAYYGYSRDHRPDRKQVVIG